MKRESAIYERIHRGKGLVYRQMDGFTVYSTSYIQYIMVII